MRRPALVLTITLTLATLPLRSVAQQNWQWVNPAPVSISWSAVAFGNGIYVAVGDGATIATSKNALDWNIRRMSTAKMNLSGVAFADGRFVAVGSSTSGSNSACLLLTSNDGFEWKSDETITGTYSGSLSKVVAGGGSWVVTGLGGGRVLTSNDGLTWRTVPTPNGLSAAQGCYGAGVFAFIAKSDVFSSDLITSSDGMNWSRVVISGPDTLRFPLLQDIAFGQGNFVLLCSNIFDSRAAFFSSPDAATWTVLPESLPPAHFGYPSIAANSSRLVVSSNNETYASPNGAGWVRRSQPLVTYYRKYQGFQTDPTTAFVTANNRFFALGAYGSITTSSDGFDWTSTTKLTRNDLLGLVHDGNRYVATGAGGTVLSSTDGLAWTSIATNTDAELGRLAFGVSRYVVGGVFGIFTSTDLANWTRVPSIGSEDVTDVVFGSGRFVATTVSPNANSTRISTNGIDWSPLNLVTTFASNDIRVVYEGGVFVLMVGAPTVGAPGIYSSTDGVNWSNRSLSLPSSTRLQSIASGAGRFMILTDRQQAITSTDGRIWSIHSLPEDPILTHVEFVGAQFVARSNEPGSPGYTSNDGIVWTKLADSIGPANAFTAMRAAGDTVVAIGLSGMILHGDRAGRIITVAPTIARQPLTQTVTAGNPTTFTVSLGGTAPFNYQWSKNGVPIDGATTSTLTLASTFTSDAGNYTITIANAAGAVTSQGATLTVNPVNTGRLVNLSILTSVDSGEKFTVGAVVGGADTSGTKPLLVRAVGPTLGTAPFNVPGVLGDPKIEIFNGTTSVASNDDWGGGTALIATTGQVGAFPFADPASKDAATLYNADAITSPAGFTVQVSGNARTSGLVLAEIYDSTAAVAFTTKTPRLVNVSVLKPIGSGLTTGFVVGGATPVKVLIRAIGPSLASLFGFSAAIVNPRFELFDAAAKSVAKNDDWGGTVELKAAFASVGAFALSADDSRDAALVATLQPGGYTVQVSGDAGTTGVALVEVYELR